MCICWYIHAQTHTHTHTNTIKFENKWVARSLIHFPFHKHWGYTQNHLWVFFATPKRRPIWLWLKQIGVYFSHLTCSLEESGFCICGSTSTVSRPWFLWVLSVSLWKQDGCSYSRHHIHIQDRKKIKEVISALFIKKTKDCPRKPQVDSHLHLISLTQYCMPISEKES